MIEEPLNELALFAGAGGGILGSHLLGWNTVCAVERDAYAAQVLAQRQNDGILPPFRGFPCQDISAAGKGAGIDGARSGMWAEMARIIGEVRPKHIFVENSPMLISRGLARVISDLATLGYDAHWARFSASNFGAPHERDRLWLASHSSGIGLEEKWITSGTGKKVATSRGNRSNVSNTQGFGREQARQSKRKSTQWLSWCSEKRAHWWSIEPGLGRVADGVAHRVDRLKAIGNGQVPIVAKNAFEYLGARS